MNLELGPLSGRLRANSPGSKFLALLPPDRSSKGEVLLLFHWGIEGFVTLHRRWKTELPKATLALLQGKFWVPSDVLLAFVRQLKTLLDCQLLGGQSLTGREAQVLQLLFRHFTNKEIAQQLKETNRLLAIIAGVSYKRGEKANPKPTILRSVALDGVSLTVNEVDEDRFSVLIIPHTLKVTTFGALRVAARLNLEIDLMARYAARLLQAPQSNASR